MPSSWFDRLNPCQPALPLPDGVGPDAAFGFLQSIRVENAPSEELAGYCRRDWRRFLHTWGLVKDFEGTCLELGANPYFTTGLLSEYTRLELSLANFFGDSSLTEGEHRVEWTVPGAPQPAQARLQFTHFNVERDAFPYPDHAFDVVIFCELIEHLQCDPLTALKEIKRVLKPGGRLILTTPNVAKLDNVFRLLGGRNINDRYSGHGPYGRHNREYTRAEIEALLSVMGFSVVTGFTANVHFPRALGLARSFVVQVLAALLHVRRRHELGQYIFVSARNDAPAQGTRPDWLFRSFAADDQAPIRSPVAST